MVFTITRRLDSVDLKEEDTRLNVLCMRGEFRNRACVRRTKHGPVPPGLKVGSAPLSRFYAMSDNEALPGSDLSKGKSVEWNAYSRIQRILAPPDGDFTVTPVASTGTVDFAVKVIGRAGKLDIQLKSTERFDNATFQAHGRRFVDYAETCDALLLTWNAWSPSREVFALIPLRWAENDVSRDLYHDPHTQRPAADSAVGRRLLERQFNVNLADFMKDFSALIHRAGRQTARPRCSLAGTTGQETPSPSFQ